MCYLLTFSVIIILSNRSLRTVDAHVEQMRQIIFHFFPPRLLCWSPRDWIYNRREWSQLSSQIKKWFRFVFQLVACHLQQSARQLQIFNINQSSFEKVILLNWIILHQNNILPTK